MARCGLRERGWKHEAFVLPCSLREFWMVASAVGGLVSVGTGLGIVGRVDPCLLGVERGTGTTCGTDYSSFIHVTSVLDLSFVRGVRSDAGLCCSILSSSGLVNGVISVGSLCALCHDLLRALVCFRCNFILPGGASRGAVSVLL